MTYTSEKIEELRALIKMMREESVSNFTAGDISITFDVMPDVKPIEMTSEDKLAILKEELKRQSDDEEADLMWSI
jgi:hypothetical protein